MQLYVSEEGNIALVPCLIFFLKSFVTFIIWILYKLVIVTTFQFQF